MRLFGATGRHALILLAVAVLCSGCGGAEYRKAKSLERGRAYYADQNYAKARVEFRNALQIAPNDAEIRYENGLVAEKLGSIQEAAQFFQGAIDANSDSPKARAELARLYLFNAAPERAMELVKPGLEKHPDDADLLTVRGTARAQLKDVAGAFEDLEAAYRIDPKNENAIAALAGMYNSDARSDKAVQILEKAVAELPKSTELRLVLAQVYASLHERTKAEAILRNLVALEPTSKAHRIRLAQFLAADNQADAAEQVLTEAIRAMPKDESIKLALVELIASHRSSEAAEAELRKLIAANPDDPEMQFALARFFEKTGDYAKAEATLDDVIAKNGTRGPGLAARDRKATLLALRNDVAGAKKLIAEVLEASPRDPDALVLRGNVLLSQGDPKGAIADLRSVLRDQPNAVGLMRVLARAHLQNNEPGLAEETLRRALDQAPQDEGVRLDLAQLLMQLDHAEQGKAMLAQLAKERPADLHVQNALFRASLATHDYPAAHAAVDAIEAGDHKGADALIYRAALAEAEGKSEDAVKLYQAALDIKPDADEPMVALARLLPKLNRIPDAIRMLDAAAKRSPTKAIPLNFKGELLLVQRKFPEAEESFRAALERAPRWWLPVRGLAYAALGRGDRAGEIRILAEAADKVDDPVLLGTELAQAYEADGKIDQAIGEYERLLKSSPNALIAANNLAMLLVTNRSDPASLARAAEITKRLGQSNSPPFLDTYGWVRLKQGDATAALAALEKAHSAAPDVAVLLYHLGMAQAAAGEADKARASLSRALSGTPTFTGRDEARAKLASLTAAR